MVITNTERYSFIKRSFTLGSTLGGEYFPFYCIGPIFRKHNADLNTEELILYSAPDGPREERANEISRYNDLIFNFERTLFPHRFKYRSNGESVSVNVCKGTIYTDEGHILMILCSNSREFPDENNFSKVLRLYVSTELAEKPVYKNLYKRLFEEVVSSCFSKKIEVVYISSREIGDRVFNCKIELDFNSIEELEEHLKTGEFRNILMSEEDKKKNRGFLVGRNEKFIY